MIRESVTFWLCTNLIDIVNSAMVAHTTIVWVHMLYSLDPFPATSGDYVLKDCTVYLECNKIY